MNKICTSIEQSKKLIELGIDIDTADMMWTYDFTIGHINGLNVISTQLKPEENDIPAWSLSALLELIPTAIDEYTDDFSRLELTKQSVSYVYAIGNLREVFLKDNLLDSAFEMICWLKENEKL